MKKWLLLFSVVGIVKTQDADEHYKMPFKLGLENISDTFMHELKIKNIQSVGLITNQTGVDQVGNRNIELLLERGIPLTHIFVPEHGINGTVHAGNAVPDAYDNQSKLPIISLYGKGTAKKFDPIIVRTIDLFIFDIQDVGMRHYTYISLLLELLKMAYEYQKPVVVLDRPNLLGARMEGPLVNNDLISFISAAPIPLRYGMTVGELACYFNYFVLEKPISLYVVPMQGYERHAPTHIFAGLSPNIQTIGSCRGYSFLGLLGEIKPFDVGVGSDKAFQCIMLPDDMLFAQEKWDALSKQLMQFSIISSYYRCVSARDKKHYSGLRLDIPDIHKIAAFEVFVHIVHFFIKQGVSLQFSPSFDKAMGISEVRTYLSESKDIHPLLEDIKKSVRAFDQRAQSIYLYDPKPFI